jgi:hypothetical protein
MAHKTDIPTIATPDNGCFFVVGSSSGNDDIVGALVVGVLVVGGNVGVLVVGGNVGVLVGDRVGEPGVIVGDAVVGKAVGDEVAVPVFEEYNFSSFPK